MNRKPRILIASAQVPFTSGGAELLVEGLQNALREKECLVDTVTLPFNAQPPRAVVEQMALWRSLDLRVFNGKPVDLVVATKFPSYMVHHPRKVVWLVHQYRQIYDLYGTRFGDVGTSPEEEAFRRMIVKADRVALREAQALYTISSNVSARLKRYLDISSSPILPPIPLGDRYRSAEPENYILSVGRVCSIKRVDLIIRAMSEIHDSLKLKIVVLPDEPDIEEYLQSEIEKHHLWNRVEFLGRVDSEELCSLYSQAFAVFFAPFDEDLGLVTLEALASGVPVITARDSGGALEFVEHGKTGLICDPEPHAIAQEINALAENSDRYTSMREAISTLQINRTWDTIVEAILAELPAQENSTTTVLPLRQNQ